MYEAPTDPLSRLSQVGHRKLSWEASHDLPEYDAVVIGSGQGGLSCAAVLAQFGRKVGALQSRLDARKRVALQGTFGQGWLLKVPRSLQEKKLSDMMEVERYEA